ncbi:MAG: DUF5946 family protein [Bacteroidota bacterium]
MQDFIDQARKNGVILLDTGRCQCCGADYPRGIFDCMDNYNNGLELLDFTNASYHPSRFLSVDAHALQHPEIHGRWSNHFHLTRLHLILALQQQWDYSKSPLLSAYLNEYKANSPDEFLLVPQPQKRGTRTAKDLAQATAPEECVALIREWAEDVYHAWSANDALIGPIADGFIAQLNRRD